MKKASVMLAPLSGLLLLSAVSLPARSAPGAIVITRSVSARSAFRPGSGPVSAEVNPGAQVQAVLGLNRSRGGLVTHELSNREFASVVTGVPLGSGGVAVPGADLSGALAGSRLDGVSRGIAGRVMTGSVGTGAGSGAGVRIGGAVRQATGQLMSALKGAGLIGR
jgi:hypothetical protein